MLKVCVVCVHRDMGVGVGECVHGRSGGCGAYVKVQHTQMCTLHICMYLFDMSHTRMVLSSELPESAGTG